MVSYSGKVIEFLSSGALKFGHVTKDGRTRLSVTDQNGRHHSVSPNNVAVVHQEIDETRSFPEIAGQLNEQILRFQDEIDTELLWESVSSEQRVFAAE